jgi:acyl carrier protein
MDSSEFVGELEELFELTAGSLQLDSVIEEIAGWSSLKFLGLIGLIDDRYDVSLNPRQVHKCSTIGDLYTLVNDIRAK